MSELNNEDFFENISNGTSGVTDGVTETNVNANSSDDDYVEIIIEPDEVTAEAEASPTYEAPYCRSYGTPSDSEIMYTPVKAEKPKKKKEHRPAHLSTVIIICAVAVVLCACAGFFGALFANKIVSPVSDPVKSKTDAPLVIYRDTSEAPPVSAPSEETGERMTYAEVAAIVKDSVVEINTEYTSRSMWFQYVNPGGAGSGVIISEDGYILTNAHVIMNEDESAVADTVTVRLPNGEEYDASVKGYDTEADIAVIKIDAEGLTPATCGNSDELLVGEELLVVGNPLGELGGTVTNGIVSATERKIEVSGTKMTLIQTNAAVNPGNSGGGMFNMKGQLVGIVNAKSSGTSVEGLGFAIPINDAISVTEQLMEYGYVRGKVEIGVNFRNVSSSSNFFYYYNVKPGVYVDSLTKGYNDDVLEVGDRIIAVDGNEISSSSDIASIIRGCSVGDKVKFQLYRDGKLLEVTVTCYEKVPTDEKEIKFDEEGENTPVPYEDGYYGGSSGIEDFFDFFFGRGF